MPLCVIITKPFKNFLSCSAWADERGYQVDLTAKVDNEEMKEGGYLHVTVTLPCTNALHKVCAINHQAL